jgi:hypothetical protein
MMIDSVFFLGRHTRFSLQVLAPRSSALWALHYNRCRNTPANIVIYSVDIIPQFGGCAIAVTAGAAKRSRYNE